MDGGRIEDIAECFEDWGMTVVKMPGEMRGWGKLGLPK